jgi:hypothetical protein
MTKLENKSNSKAMQLQEGLDVSFELIENLANIQRQLATIEIEKIEAQLALDKESLEAQLESAKANRDL